MAKRFTDTEKWDDDWFVSLPPRLKIFWIYLCDKCDHAGVWRVSAHVAKALIGEDVDLAQAREAFGDRIKEVDGYWWLTKFCDFQYGKLNEENKVHKSALKILSDMGLASSFEGPSKGLASPLQGAKDKDKAKDKDPLLGFDAFWLDYPRSGDRGKPKRKPAEQKWARMNEADRASARAGLAKFKASVQWQKNGGTFIPAAVVYLNQELWNDDPGTGTDAGGRGAPRPVSPQNGPLGGNHSEQRSRPAQPATGFGQKHA